MFETLKIKTLNVSITNHACSRQTALVPIPVCITKTRLYNFDPLKPHFYILKLGFTGVYIIFFYFVKIHRLWVFLIFAQKRRLWYSLEPPRRGGSNEYHNLCFWAEIWKISEFFIWIFSFFGGKIFNVFELACFCNGLVKFDKVFKG